MAIAALSMRQILVQRARARNAAKRGGGGQRVTLNDDALAHAQPAFAVADGPGSLDLAALDDALSRLALLDPEQARIVELRYFGGRRWRRPPGRWASRRPPSSDNGPWRAPG